MRKKRVAIILWGEIKYDGRVKKEIKTLQNNGYEVYLIVSKFINDSKLRYNFKIIPLTFQLSKNPVKNFLSYKNMCKKAAVIVNKIGADILHCNDLNSLYTALYYKKKYGNIKVIFDSHELFPEMQKGFLRKYIWNRIEKKLLPYIDDIIMPEKNRAYYFKKKYNYKKHITIIPNYPSKGLKVSNINYIERDIPETIGKIKVLFIGAMMPDRNLEEISLAFKKLPKIYVLVLIGTFSKGYKKKLISFLCKNKLENRVFLHDPVLHEHVLLYINSSNIGLVFYKNNNLNNYYCASNKLFEFIMLKKPVITNDYPGLIEVVEKNQLGICIPEVTIENIIDSLKKIERLKPNLDVEFFWEMNEKKFLQVYNI